MWCCFLLSAFVLFVRWTFTAVLPDLLCCSMISMIRLYFALHVMCLGVLIMGYPFLVVCILHCGMGRRIGFCIVGLGCCTLRGASRIGHMGEPHRLLGRRARWRLDD